MRVSRRAVATGVRRPAHRPTERAGKGWSAVTGESDLFQAQAELHDAISDVLSRHGLMANRWLLGAEVLDADGDRAMEAFTSPDMRAWDSLGILGFLDARERAGIVREEIDRDGPGE